MNSTVLGHSYGTLVAGKALAENPELPVDNVIFVGSPGGGRRAREGLGGPAGQSVGGHGRPRPHQLGPFTRSGRRRVVRAPLPARTHRAPR
ncbi:alpha/beta hydrolase [Streptomyces sp. NPDC001552]|uniref:alpha/beta hydrolase n=1 Tax=Streptomyces sp. NPDC001552 TaxID=3364587 RepID=UPI0036942157